MEYLNSIQKNKILKVKNNLLKLKKCFRELKDRETKIRTVFQDLFPKSSVPLLPRPKKLF